VGNSSSTSKTIRQEYHLSKEIKKVCYPLLVVPPGISYSPIRKICFAFDNKKEEDDSITYQLKQIVTQLNSSLHVLYAHTGKNAGEDQIEILQQVQDQLADVNPSYHVIHPEGNIVDGIHAFLEREQINLVVLVPHSYSFFESLFHKSQSKAIAGSVQIPVVMLHE
jgi:nucleotide-binding universal stress UspA family protein